MNVAVYPGSFDPITNGHLDIIERAAAVFDRVIVGVLANPRKTPLLPIDVRIAVISQALHDADLPTDRLTVSVRRPDGRLLSDERRRIDRPRAARHQRLRGRDAARPQQPRPGARVDTVFFMTSVANGYVSSSLVKEIASFGGDVTSMIPTAAGAALAEALGGR